VLNPDEWEARLVAHYLRSDGPFGGSPLAWLDATPAELAIASGLDGLSDSQAQAAFLKQFQRAVVQWWLDGRVAAAQGASEYPGYFRYLVLTCLVSATDEGAGETHDFRKRLGELVDGVGPIQAVSRVNRLWKSLAAWCDRCREAGEPIRKVILPNPGTMKLIGCAVRIAFPSWRDRSALTRILRSLPEAVRRSPQRLIEELDRPHHYGRFSPALLSALGDFAHRFRASRSLLGGHRFWRLVESIDERLQAEGGGTAAARWRLEVSFGGWEQDLVEARLFRGRRRSVEAGPEWEGAFAELASLPAERLPAAVTRCLEQGTLILGEAPGAVWVLDDVGLHNDVTVVVLSRAGGVADTLPLPTRWRDLSGGWAVSDRLDPDAVAGLARRLGLAVAGGERLFDLGFEGGVATRRGSWLGRPGFLPDVRTSPASTISVRPVAPTSEELVAGNGTILRPLSAPSPRTGRWVVVAREGGADVERILVLEADAPERWDWPGETPAWESEREVETIEERPAVAAAAGEDADLERSSPLDHLLEALYARVGRGRGEAELVELLKPVLPNTWMVWDVLRSLAEAGWMEVQVYRAWRARRWKLSRPSLVRVGPDTVLVEGAIGAAARRRLAAAAFSAGGRLLSRGGAIWSVPVLIVVGANPNALAAAMEWPLVPSTRPHLAPAPACWPIEKRSGEGRELAGLWDFESGLFRPAPNGSPDGIRLERLVRDDDRDLYRLVVRDSTFLATSRTVAILEAHRRAHKPLFRWSAGSFRRLGRSGHLPLPVARALRRQTLGQSGLLAASSGEWTYTYPADPLSATWAASAFGSAVEAPGTAQTSSRLGSVVALRRAGRAPRWWVSSVAGREGCP
jgi:hypothetical protein